MHTRFAFALLLALSVGCGDDDDGGTDSGTGADAGVENPLIGKVYVREGYGVGQASYHFDAEDDVYISYADAPMDWVLDDGMPFPDRKSFAEIEFDIPARRFVGVIDWALEGRSAGGASRWVYEMVFSADYTAIESGTIYFYDSEGASTMTVAFGGELQYYEVGRPCGNGVRDPDEVCDSNDDVDQTCAELGMGFNAGTLRCSSDCTAFDTSTCILPDYSCLGMNTPPAPTTATGDITVTASEFATPGLAITGVTLDAFDAADLTETTSIATATTGGIRAALTVPLGASGWDGFVRATPADATLKGAYYMQNQPFVGDTGVPLPMLTPASWLRFHELAGIAAPDPTLGSIGVDLNDCRGNPAPSMTLEVTPTDATTVVGYVVDRLPDLTATESDAAGQGLVLHSAVGPVTVTASAPPAPGMTPVVIATTTVEVRPDVSTALVLVPD